MGHFEKWVTSENGHNDIDHFENWSDRFQSASFVEMTIFSKCLLFKVTNFLNWPIFSNELCHFPKFTPFRNDSFLEVTYFSKRQILRSGSESGSFSKTIWQARNSFLQSLKSSYLKQPFPPVWIIQLLFFCFSLGIEAQNLIFNPSS